MMSSKSARAHKRRFRRVDATGRSKGGQRFVRLAHYVLDCEAYCTLKPAARALYTELRRRYNGLNNGKITLSVREAARELHIAKDTAAKAFADLQEKGFIRIGRPGSFHFKVAHATEWILTEEAYGDELPTKDFMRWRAVKKNCRSQKIPARCQKMTGQPSESQSSKATVPPIGTATRFEQ